MRTKRNGCAGVLAAGLAALSGCAMGGRVELAAADSIESVASELAQAMNEYQRDIGQLDDERERAVVMALIARVRRDAADDEQVNAHVLAYEEAAARVRADREAARVRRSLVEEHVDSLREVAAGLRRLGIESMSLEDETKRYLRDVIERSRDRIATTGADDAAAGADRTATGALSAGLGDIGE